MELKEIVLTIATLFNLSLGLFIFLKDRKNKINISYGLLSVGLAGWALTNAIFQITYSLETALFWARLSDISAIILVSSLFWFSLVFPDNIVFPRYLYYIFYVFTFIVVLISLPTFDLVRKEVIFQKSFQKQIITAEGFYIFAFYIILFSTWAIINLKKKLTRSRGIVRFQLQYVFIGIIIGAIFGLIFNLILPLVGNYGLVWLGPIFTLVSLIFIALAITRYHLFGIKIILTELLVGVMAIILFSWLFILPTPALKLGALATFLIFLAFGYFLIQYTYREEALREQAEKLAQRERELRQKAEALATQERKLRLELEDMLQKERSLRLQEKTLSQARDQFILSSQHYFRTPLTTILGFLELTLAGDFGKITPSLRKKLTIIRESALELRKRIEEGLDITQFQLGRAILQPQPTNIRLFLQDIIHHLQPAAQLKHLSITLQPPPHPLPHLSIDPKRMKEALVNLIDNAIKHTLQGGVTISLQLHPSPTSPSSLLIIIKDTGIGIAPQELPLLGQIPFQRGETAKKHTPLGKGIGLYLSRLIIEAHGGKLTLSSKGKNQGTTVIVELPIKSPLLSKGNMRRETKIN